MTEDLNRPNPEEAGAAGQEGNTPIPINTEQNIDWEKDSNPYKKRYGESQSQIQPLVNVLRRFADYDHQTGEWKPRQAESPKQEISTDDFNKMLDGYDPEFVKSLRVAVGREVESGITKFRDSFYKENSRISEYNSTLDKSRKRVISEFGSRSNVPCNSLK